MVLGFETAERTPSSVPPSTSPSPSHSASHATNFSVPHPGPAGALDDGRTGPAHILSNATAIPIAEPEHLRAGNNMSSQDGEVEGRPPFLHVGRSLFVVHYRRTAR